MEISKELFENVMGIKLGNAHNTEQELLVTNQVAMFTDIKKTYKLGHPIDTINIYELAHKCKEWALKHHYKVISKPDNVPGLWEAYVNLSLTSKHGEVADTEPEAIFKACQWILDKDRK